MAKVKKKKVFYQQFEFLYFYFYEGRESAVIMKVGYEKCVRIKMSSCPQQQIRIPLWFSTLHCRNDKLIAENLLLEIRLSQTAPRVVPPRRRLLSQGFYCLLNRLSEIGLIGLMLSGLIGHRHVPYYQCYGHVFSQARHRNAKPLTTR